MNEYEAQLKVAELVKGVLIDLYGAADVEAQDEMGDVADLIVEALGLQAVSVDGDQVTCTLDLSDPE